MVSCTVVHQEAVQLTCSNTIICFLYMKKAIFIIALLVLTFSANAAERSEAAMRAIAAAKLSNTREVKGMLGGTKSQMELLCVSNEKAFSVFTPESGKGFVIVAKSDKMEPVIGYGAGHFDADNIPSGLKWYLDEVSRELEAAEQRGIRHAPRRAIATYTPVENFVTTQWSQEFPYDRKTPNNWPSGCVATALAQCMNYCQWPASASFTGTYYITTKRGTQEKTERKTEDVSTTYTWPYKDTYKSFGRWGDNVDELLRDCGYATYMDYSKDGSGAVSYMTGVALTTVFGYPEESVKYLQYDYLCDPDLWAQIIYDELGKRSPVYYAASDASSGGHAFVFSGIDEDGLVYVNWGWRGTADGFYAITNLNPKANGEENLFDHSMSVVYGIRPQPLPTDHIEGRIYAYTGDPFTFRFGTEKDDDEVEHITLYCDIPYGFINLNSSEFRGVFGLFAQDLTEGTDWVIEPDLQDRDTIPAGYGYAGSSAEYKEFYFYYFIDGEKGLKPGHTYRMSFGTKDDREGTWHSILCHGGELAYDITYTGDPATCVISEEKTQVPILTSIHDVHPDNAAGDMTSDIFTRVYNTSGRLVYIVPTSQFNLWDIPAHGVLIVKQGKNVRKVVR